MENTVLVKLYNEKDLPPINEREVWRYSGYPGDIEQAEPALKAEYKKVAEELSGKLDCKVCCRKMSLEWKNLMPVLPFDFQSEDLANLLKGCREIVIFAATIGLEVDRLIARYQKMSVVKALIAQALGAERIEALCDLFCRDIEREATSESAGITERYSPGYGDLPLAAQKDMFRLLDCSRKIGISLNESLLMTPSKSVTAIFGIGSEIGNNKTKCGKCSACSKIDCEFRSISDV